MKIHRLYSEIGYNDVFFVLLGCANIYTDDGTSTFIGYFN